MTAEITAANATNRTRRRRAKVTQTEVGRAFPVGISAAAVSLYEAGLRGLPLDYTHEDYARALEAAIAVKGAGQ